MSDFDELALDIVCVERVPMRLLNEDLVEAVRRLSAKGLQPTEIARLAKTNCNYVGRLQRRHNITPAPPEMGWCAYIRGQYYRNSQREQQRRRRQSRRAEVAEAT